MKSIIVLKNCILYALKKPNVNIPYKRLKLNHNTK